MAKDMSLVRAILVWATIVTVVGLPIYAASTSRLLAWRDPIYIGAGFAGVAAMALMLLQPLLAGGYLPGLRAYRGRRVHRWTGGMLVLMVVLHVAGLFITSPPDVIDALLFASPTPFSSWGVAAMSALFATALLVALRRRFHRRLRLWRVGHTTLAVVIVVGSAVHAMLVEGTMETISKGVLCASVLIATAKVVIDLRVWAKRKASR
ncbi:ferric reductase-like transmembrane domain-containing protein [Defluviimonas sp. WL0002]|uniref:Ferric reductase-like transmembrane domain-containing protein n=1 Tax=Albidovulum marisflavi TaxID=2984159 RepID=A0ABT2ZCD8_9RHOB|nr:ferric reductase-like transmembrane domain-containing protein [Defluviimonas sp. WL0002]MCV2868687.1 ferric reductase-like transmembrane domain-containing protein [Defluviimonas sp. WL0002]